MKFGIFVSGGSGELSHSNKLLYDSTKPHLQVDLLASPKRFNVVTMSAGISTVPVAEGAGYEEQIYQVNYDLGYEPRVLVYYFVYPKTDPEATTGSYSTGNYIFSGSTVDDLIRYEINDSSLTIFHKVENYLFGGPYTSVAPNYYLRLKYALCSNPASNTFVDISGNNVLVP